jgi:hypothetical protein
MRWLKDEDGSFLSTLMSKASLVSKASLLSKASLKLKLLLE